MILEAGNPIAVKVNVTNVGEVEGSYDVRLKVDNVVVSTREVTLGGGDTTTVFFTYSTDDIGTHYVEVDGLTDTFIVSSPEPIRPVAIVSPKDEFEVPWRHTIQGMAQEEITSLGLNVYILIYPVESDGPWWVQPPVVVTPEGYWQADAYFGRDPAAYPEDIGDFFYVIAIATGLTLEPGQQWHSLPAFAYTSNAVLVSRR